MSKRLAEGAVTTAQRREQRLGEAPTLAGKVVLVTGASSGIGRAIALACAEAGADLALTFRENRTGADEAAGSVRAAGRRVEVVRADVSRQDDLDALAAGARRAFGRIDVWINNAGADILTGEGARLSWTEKLDRLLAVDLRGTVLASWTAVALMREQPAGGVILNMSWDHVLTGAMRGEYSQVFCAVKGGVYSFSRAPAQSAAPHVRGNVLGPGWGETAYGRELDQEASTASTKPIPPNGWPPPQTTAQPHATFPPLRPGYVPGRMLLINGGAIM